MTSKHLKDESCSQCIVFKVDFNTNLKTPKERDDYKIELGDDVYSGESNGLTVYLDVEEYDHGYLPAKGIFFYSSF